MSGSGSDRKKNPLVEVKMKEGWEEARGEFFQESYPGAETDMETLEDPQKISTLLPSKMTRTGTTNKYQKLTLRHKKDTETLYQATTSVDASNANDVEVAIMPDLSENLANERLLYEEIMLIKAMPINMAQKKELKATLLSRDTLRLQGLKHLSWKQKQNWMRTKVRLKEVFEKLTLWRGSFNRIEGYYGTGVVSFFLFVKYLVFLNAVISLFILAVVVYPAVYSRSIRVSESFGNATFSNATTRESSAMISNPLDYFLVTGEKEPSPFYYNYYKYEAGKTLDVGFVHFNLPLTYVVATFIYLAYSFASIVKNAAKVFKHKLLERQGQFYVFCNLLFSGWDFCISDVKAADVKSKALHNEILGRLNSQRKRCQRKNRTKRETLELFAIRSCINLATIVLLALAGIVIYEVFITSSKSESGGVLRGFLPAGVIVFFNVAFPNIFHWLGSYERYSPMVAVQVTIFRTVTLRYSSLCVLLASVYNREIRQQDCWELYLARELHKLLILSAVAQVFSTFFLDFPRALAASRCRSKLIRYMGEQRFHIPTHVLDVVYVQTIVWLGAFYAPLLPVVGCVILVILFYVKKFACLVNCRPDTDVYYASRSHSFFMFILLASFVFSVVPWAFSITEIPPSTCGPFGGYNYVWSVVTKALSTLQIWVHVATFCASSAFLMPVFVSLAFLNYYYYAVYTANKQMVTELKRQLVLEGHDKQFLLNRLSAIMTQQQQQRRRRHRKTAMESGE